jgi:galactosylxylosylprotein 3-beta-galactosyltransferase
MEDIMFEAREFNDMIIFPTVTDSISSLSNRTLFSFKYVHESLKYKYVLKCDDDSFVDLPHIASELQLRKSDSPLYWGYMSGNSYVRYIGHYTEHSWNVCDDYLTYAFGGGYVLSRHVTGILAENAENLKMYACEDVAMGAWLAPYNIELKHDARFNVNTPSRGCKDPFLISHKVTAERMYIYHDSMLSEGRMCSWKTYSWGQCGYVYDWTKSTCCNKNSFVP